MAGRPIWTHHATALGGRHALADAAGNPIWARDAAGHGGDAGLRRPQPAADRDDATRRRREAAHGSGATSPTTRALPTSPRTRRAISSAGSRRSAMRMGCASSSTTIRGLVTPDQPSLLVAAGCRRHGRWDDPASQLWTEGDRLGPADPDRPSATSVAAYLALPDLADATTLDRRHDLRRRRAPDRSPLSRGDAIATYLQRGGLLERVEVDRGDGRRLSGDRGRARL